MATLKKNVTVEGGHYLKAGAVASVVAVRWAKDGDYPAVQRYPIEGRVYKGLLEVSPKERYSLKFGDWVVEDGEHVYVVDEERFAREYKEVPEKIVAPKVKPAVAALLVLIAAAVIARLLFTQDEGVYLFSVTHLMYYRALLGQWNGLANSVFDLDTDTIKVSAHTNTYSPNQDTHEFFSDLTNEVTGTNYTAGGATLASPTVTRTTGTVTFDANDVVWTTSAGGFSTARKFVVYRSTGAGATSKLYSVVTADGDVGNVTGDLTIQWNASGISTWTTT